ncbi:hypothetical protein LVB77_00700 [Lysobacter sp. 5GHs7-4]|uniref:hypothetical protein n=1 Tax=Lysobacter sp. 5GHs7-4 TaxID=2904253 RepID=UPI001E2D9501|nr:hypothetical protein [Lysobacter sp. 5GHs7-4]UHQ23266.1 hypothetical protein LVB77_00700 [Lysobacter sp. 5GHs7-4]
MPPIRRALAALLLIVVACGGCDRTPSTDRDAPPKLPAEAVQQLVHDLRRNDLAGYARHAVPPALHDRLEIAWREGRTTWPLTELPLEDRLPGFLQALAAPGAEKKLQAVYQRQFAGAHTELRSAAATLGLFATQYVRSEGDYSDEERDHYAQLIGAISAWGQRAPLGDPKRARIAIPQLAAAARQTGLTGADALRLTGMARSLERLGPFFGRFKQVLVSYGLDVDAGLDRVEATLAEQTGDSARVRLRYTIAGQPIDAYVRVERLDGRWYLSDVLRHAEAEATRPLDAGSAHPTAPAAATAP